MKFLKELNGRPILVNGMPIHVEELGDGYGLIETDDPTVIAGLDAFASAKRHGITRTTDAAIEQLKKKLEGKRLRRPSRSILQQPFRVERPARMPSAPKNASPVAEASSQPDKPKGVPLKVPGRLGKVMLPAPEEPKPQANAKQAKVPVAPDDDDEFPDELPKRPIATN